MKEIQGMPLVTIHDSERTVHDRNKPPVIFYGKVNAVDRKTAVLNIIKDEGGFFVEKLIVKNVSKVKGKKHILKRINLELKRGEVLGFLGANGAGKTTTLKCILGLCHFEGEIKIAGLDTKKESGRVSRMISGLIEEPCFYPDMTGLENLKINMMYYGIPSKRRMDEIITDLKMTHFINDKVKTYSLGMRQRLGIALALSSEPEIILLDEPMNGLDPDGIKELRELLITLAHKEGKAILVSSHILSEMQMLCDRVVFIRSGEIVGNESVGSNLEERYMKKGM